jgi:hypothetical protein
VVADGVPIAYGAFEDDRMGGVTLSSKAVDSVRRMLKGEAVTQETSGMSKGVWREFEAARQYRKLVPAGVSAVGAGEHGPCNCLVKNCLSGSRLGLFTPEGVFLAGPASPFGPVAWATATIAVGFRRLTSARTGRSRAERKPDEGPVPMTASAPFRVQTHA